MPRAPLTLRTKLVLATTLIAFVAVTIVGAVSIVALQRSLEARLDDQLASAFNRASAVVTLAEDGRESDERHGEESMPDALMILNGPAQAPGTLALVLHDETATAGYLGESGRIFGLDTRQLDALSNVNANAEPQTLSLPGLGDYRVQASAVDDNAVLVGVPLRDLRQTLFTLSASLFTVAALAMFALAVVSTLVIRRALRPLEQVANAADQVADLQLDRGAVSEFDQVSVDGLDERTEVGRVVTAVNAMMRNVQSALVTREASEQKIRSFVADASHELRTPLASIRGYSELVRRMGGELPADVQRAIGRIESESLRMTELVEDLLLLARLDEGQELALERVNLSEIARDALADAAVADSTHNWSIDGADSEHWVLGDRHRLQQVVANLLSNARVHTPAGTDVTVGLKRRADRVQLTVTDTGPGVPKTIQPNVFSRFVRADSARSKTVDGGGSGLGLSIVAALVAAHSGKVTLRSKPGKTVFTVDLPAASDLPAAEDLPAAS